MNSTFFFYDLETTGFNPREARIMQFAGQRTNMQLEPVGEPVNLLIKLSPDILPDPDAILVTGIIPQSTISDGITEFEFLHQFHEEIALPGTIFVGYNTVKFDDEFMRYINYRNFYDAYEWQWKDGKSRWDLLDVVRMTRALRPEGIKWPFASDGKPSNQLGLLTTANKLDHANAHDALSDVYATIELAKLIQNKQPKLFQFLLDKRGKREAAGIVETGQPFVYSSSSYSSEFEKTTVVAMITKHPKQQGVFVYDLRQDPDEFKDLTATQLTEAMRWKKPNEEGLRLPVQLLQFNRCPAVAPLSVLSQTSEEQLRHLKLDMKVIEENQRKLTSLPDFVKRLLEAIETEDKKRQTEILSNKQVVDAQLYDGFFSDEDRTKMSMVRATEAKDFDKLEPHFSDNRLSALLPLYKARNFPSSMTSEERSSWELFRKQRLLDGDQASRMAKYFERLQTLSVSEHLTSNQQYLLEELRLYGESIMPNDID